MVLLLEAQDLQLHLLQVGQEEQGVLQDELLRVNQTTGFLLLEALMLHSPNLRVLIENQVQVDQEHLKLNQPTGVLLLEALDLHLLHREDLQD